MTKETSLPPFPKWFAELVKSVRSQGVEVLWQNLGAEGESELMAFFEAMREGWEEEKDRNWLAARVAYKEAGRRFPMFADIAVLRDEIVVEEGLNRAIEYYNRGVRALKAKSFRMAIDAFLLALEVDPKMSNAWYNLALAYKMRYLGDPKAYKEGLFLAEEALEKLLAIDPEHKKALALTDSIEAIKK